MTSAQIGNIERPHPSVVRNADILMYDEGLFCGTGTGRSQPDLASPIDDRQVRRGGRSEIAPGRNTISP
jgi:hypothetical protein